MTLSVIVNGANGKMGTLACQLFETSDEFSLVAALGREDALAEAILRTKADIVVDLTNAQSVYQNALTIIEHGAHPVIGTSGLRDDEIATLTQRCVAKKCGGIIVPNFSLAAVLMMRFSAMAAAFFPEAEIIEIHHQQKQDSPSGTAMKTAEMIAKARTMSRNILPSREVVPGTRGGVYHDVPLHALRLPGVLAKQEVIFGGQGETLTLSHNTLSRECFMPGLRLACLRVVTLNTLYYGLEHIIPTAEDSND